MVSSDQRWPILATSAIALSHFMKEVQLSTLRGMFGWARLTEAVKLMDGFLASPFFVVMRMTPFSAPRP